MNGKVYLNGTLVHEMYGILLHESDGILVHKIHGILVLKMQIRQAAVSHGQEK